MKRKTTSSPPADTPQYGPKEIGIAELTAHNGDLIGVTPPLVKNCTLRNQAGLLTLSGRNLRLRSPASFLQW
jgi:hypothetical protein